MEVKTKQLNVLMEMGLYKEAMEAADKDGRSLSGLVRKLLTDYCKNVSE